MTEPTIYNLKHHLININDRKNLDELNKIMLTHNLSSDDKLSSIRVLVTHSNKLGVVQKMSSKDCFIANFSVWGIKEDNGPEPSNWIFGSK